MSWEEIIKEDEGGSYRDRNPYDLEEMIDTLEKVMNTLKYFSKETKFQQRAGGLVNPLHEVWAYLTDLLEEESQ